MRGGSKIVWCVPLLQLLLACGTTSYEEKVDLFHGSPVRSVLILPFINYSGVPDADTEVNNVFVAEFKKNSSGRVFGKKDLDNYLRKRGLKKRPIFDRKMALTLGRLFKVDSVIYGTILSYMKPVPKSENVYTSLAMNVRVIDIKSGRIIKAYSLSKDITPSFWTSTRTKFQRTLNDSISHMVSDLLEGGASWE
jgi:hypothetical protein